MLGLRTITRRPYAVASLCVSTLTPCIPRKENVTGNKVHCSCSDTCTYMGQSLRVQSIRYLCMAAVPRESERRNNGLLYTSRESESGTRRCHPPPPISAQIRKRLNTVARAPSVQSRQRHKCLHNNPSNSSIETPPKPHLQLPHPRVSFTRVQRRCASHECQVIHVPARKTPCGIRPPHSL